MNYHMPNKSRKTRWNPAITEIGSEEKRDESSGHYAISKGNHVGSSAPERHPTILGYLRGKSGLLFSLTEGSWLFVTLISVEL